MRACLTLVIRNFPEKEGVDKTAYNVHRRGVVKVSTVAWGRERGRSAERANNASLPSPYERGAEVHTVCESQACRALQSTVVVGVRLHVGV